MTFFIPALIGLIAGAILLHEGGAWIGLMFGLLAGMAINLQRRIQVLEHRLIAADHRPREETTIPAPTAFSPSEETATEEAPEEKMIVIRSSAPASSYTAPREETASRQEGDVIQRGMDTLRVFFTSGNLVVKVGVIVLFFGVAFLLKYAVEHSHFPIELRFISTAVGALGLLMIGWRLRTRRAGYALIIQGAAVGVLYLTVFAAAKLYDLAPLGFALGVMVCLVMLSGVLAVLQDARALAGFGAAGGFLAPVLLSTGGGNHVVLFSYYLLLNAGILGVAWFKSWRELNLVGFAFTFVVGALWGHRNYEPAYFASTEPFLVVFFLFYVAIAILFAHRQPPQLKGYVDGSLVFGVPIVGFSLQIALVRSLEYGAAISALALGIFYLLTAILLWRRQVAGMRLLTEAFLALGVVFGSLAVPLAVDGNWTAAAWALEGVALVWLGVRQERLTARIFGSLLQIGAGVAFIATGAGRTLLLSAPPLTHGVLEVWPIVNAWYLGSAVIGVAGLMTSYYLERNTQRLREGEKFLLPWMLAWGLIWWFGGGLHEIHHHLDWPDTWVATLLFFALSGVAMGWVARRLAWARLGLVPTGLLPVMLLIALWTFLVGFPFSGTFHLFAGWGALAWGVAFTGHLWLLHTFERSWQEPLVKWWHVLNFLLLVFVLTHEAAWGVTWLGSAGPAWGVATWALVPTLFIWALVGGGRRLTWPVARFYVDYLGRGVLPLIVFLWCWGLRAALNSGEVSPLPYWPLFNPLDLAQLLAVLTAVRWAWHVRAQQIYTLTPSLFVYGQAGVIFVWLIAAVARAVHAFAGAPYTLAALYHSVIFQAALTLTWSILALVAMVFTARRGARTVWFGGSGLLALVVVKLFLVDLTGIGTVARIISFLGVGLLMLVIGYFSPLPPRQANEAIGEKP
ncbi:MAG TPA: DUF2339 domain-containing protein [Acidiferrobacterales bacterium]|nr:DUF2339 domain-containing protein [Acidiferrobacterales bacterium]